MHFTNHGTLFLIGIAYWPSSTGQTIFTGDSLAVLIRLKHLADLIVQLTGTIFTVFISGQAFVEHSVEPSTIRLLISGKIG